MLDHTSPQVQEAYHRRQNVIVCDGLWSTTPAWLWKDGYTVGYEEGHTSYIQNLSTGPNLFAAKGALQEIAREVGVDVNLDGDLEASTFRELVEAVRATVARALPAPWFQEFQKQHGELDSAYHRLRDLANATHVPGYWRPEEPLPSRTWSWTEARLRTIVEERDRLKATLAAVRKEIREAGVGAE